MQINVSKRDIYTKSESGHVLIKAKIKRNQSTFNSRDVKMYSVNLKKIIVFCAFVVILFIMSINNVNGGAFLPPPVPRTHPNHPKKCWDPETQKAYAVGEKISKLGECRQKLCQSNFIFLSLT